MNNVILQQLMTPDSVCIPRAFKTVNWFDLDELPCVLKARCVRKLPSSWCKLLPFHPRVTIINHQLFAVGVVKFTWRNKCRSIWNFHFLVYNESNLFLIPKYNIQIKIETFGATIISRYARMNIFLSELISDSLRTLGVVETITALWKKINVLFDVGQTVKKQNRVFDVSKQILLMPGTEFQRSR